MNIQRAHPIAKRDLVISVIGALVLALVTLSANSVSADTGDSGRLGFFSHSVEWITRNIVDGSLIKVCSEVYPNATQEAIERWNSALSVRVFVFAGRGASCELAESDKTPSAGVPSVFVNRGKDITEGGVRYFGAHFLKNRKGKPLKIPVADGIGIAGFDHHGLQPQDFVGNDLWRSYWGRGEVVIDMSNYNCDVDPEPGYEPAPGVPCIDAEEIVEERNLVHVITHELGHILGLADYYCNHPDVTHTDYLAESDNHDEQSLMNSWNTEPGCDPSVRSLTLLDKTDYRTAYLPAAVTMLAGEAAAGAVTLTWDQSDVFVEADFEIQRAVDYRVLDPEWVFVGTAPANAESVRLFEEPGGWQRYRVVGRTKALPPASGRAGLGAARRG